MPISTSAQAFLEAMSALSQPPDVTVVEFRAQLERLLPAPSEPEPVARVIDRTIRGGDGQPLGVRVYAPAVDGPAPAAIWMHGGSFVRGTLDAFDTPRREFANAAGFVVVAVDQRLAPEACFPAPLEDAYAAWRWTVEHAEELGVDSDRVGVAGESSGANLAAATALLACAGRAPTPAFQILVVPILDATCAMPSVAELADGYLLTRAQLRWLYEQYAPGVDRREPLLSPLHAPSVHGLPPAVIVTVEYDPARDEGEAYAERLAAAAVPVLHTRLDGMVHHFPGPDAIPIVADLSTRILAHLRGGAEVAR
jgi:acetyl esterase